MKMMKKQISMFVATVMFLGIFFCSPCFASSDLDGVWLTQDYVTYPNDNKVFSRTRYDVVLTKETQCGRA